MARVPDPQILGPAIVRALKAYSEAGDDDAASEQLEEDARALLGLGFPPFVVVASILAGWAGFSIGIAEATGQHVGDVIGNPQEWTSTAVEDDRPAECCCAGCIGMGPCDDDLGKSDEPECDHPWHDGEDVAEHAACPRCGVSP